MVMWMLMLVGAAVSPQARPHAHPANGVILAAASGRPVAAVDANGPISDAVADGRGGWFIAGGFSIVDGRRRANLAHVRADGSLDQRWRGPALGPPDAFTHLSVALDGARLLVAGARIRGSRGSGIVAVRASNGIIDSGWRTQPVCADGAWIVQAGAGRVWVATACAAPPCLVALGASAGRRLRWSARIAAIGETGCVNGVAVARSGVFLTGGFTAVRAVPRPGLAAVNAVDGRVLAGFAPRGTCAQDSHAVSVLDGRVFAGGDGCPAAAFAVRGGKQLWAWPRLGNAGTLTMLAIAGRVYAGGAFSRLAGIPAHGLVALDTATGRPVPSWHPRPPDTLVESLTESRGRILVGAG
jgi:hypothetical protein